MPSLSFSFSNLATEFLSSSEEPRVKLIPLFTPLRFSGSIVTSDPVEAALDVTSSATFPTVLPGVYNVEVFTHAILSSFQVLIPNDASGDLNAADYFLSPYTGSTNTDGTTYKLVAVPVNTASLGRNGWVAFTTSSIHFYYDSVWHTVPVSVG